MAGFALVSWRGLHSFLARIVFFGEVCQVSYLGLHSFLARFDYFFGQVCLVS